MEARRSRFGKYELLRKLASGGMGEVFLAKRRGSSGFDELVVIKRILGRHLDKKDYLDMFFAEARLVAGLDHPHVIRIHEMGEIAGDHYIAMEYVRGKSLREVIDELRAEGRHLPLAHAVELGIDLADGLGHAHDARDPRGRPLSIVHRDINPHNILVSYRGELKLIDFGIAKSAMTSVETATGTIKGKFVYMSPEQSAAEPLDHRSDIFSLGIVLYEMLTLENPFVRPNVVLALEAIQRRPVAPPSARRPEAAPLDAVLLRALEKRPEHRFQSAHEVRDALRALLRSGAIPAPDVGLGPFLEELFGADIAQEDRRQSEAAPTAGAVPPVGGPRELADASALFVADEPTLPLGPKTVPAPTGPIQAEALEPSTPRPGGWARGPSRSPLARPEPSFGRGSEWARTSGRALPAARRDSGASELAERARTSGRALRALGPALARALLVVATGSAGFFATRLFLDARSGAAAIPPAPVLPPSASRSPGPEGEAGRVVSERDGRRGGGRPSSGPTGGLPPTKEPEPLASAPFSGRRRTGAGWGGASSPGPGRARAARPEVRGHLRVSASTPLSVIAEGRSVGAAPALWPVQDVEGKLVLSGGRDVDYALTFAFRIEPTGIRVEVDSAPWALVEHDGVALGRTPQGPVPAAPGHTFAFVRPGQRAPLVVRLAWSPD